MDLEPPESQAATIGIAVGATALGAAAGAGALHALAQAAGKKASLGQDPATLVGALIGSLVVGFGGVVLSEVSEEWSPVGKAIALVGVGLTTTAAVVGATGVGKAAFAKGGVAPPALPAPPAATSTPSAPTGQVFTATSADSGRVLNMHVGDILKVSLPAAVSGSGQEWEWTASVLNIIDYSGPILEADAQGNATELDAFTGMAVGQVVLTAQLVTTATKTVSAQFQVTVNVVA